MQNLLPILIGAVALATALNVFFKRFNIPTVIGYIVTGAIIGPLFGIYAHGNEQLEHVAVLGIVFLMFTIGLEVAVSHLLVSMNKALEELVKELASYYDDAEMCILNSMTSEEHQGLSRIREAFLNEEAGLHADTKALLLSCTNHIDWLRTLLESGGDSYRRLAGLAEASAAA